MRTTSVVALLALVLAGTRVAHSQSSLQSWSGGPGHPFFGQAVVSLGDVDGDGTPDMAVGDPSGAGFAGEVSVFSGKSGALILSLSGQVPGNEFGASLAGLGDLNGDGVPDLAVGVPLSQVAGPGSGRVELRSGADGSLIDTLHGLGFDSHFGASLTHLDDVDGDGVRELFVGAPRAGFDHRGAAFIYSGATRILLQSLEGQAKDDFFGTAVSSAGDVDGDGLADVLVGAPQSADKPGYVQARDVASGNILLMLMGDNPGDGFGSSVAGLGDVTGDGRADVAVGVPGLDLLHNEAGGVLVFDGKLGALLQLHAGDEAWAGLGFSLAALGDVNGDGLCDLAAGTDRIEGGSVHIWSGGDGASLSVVAAYPGNSTALGSGVRVAPAGDLDGDGRPDLLVGAPTRLVSSGPGSAQVVKLAFLPWLDVGGGLVGSHGAPALEGEGDLLPGTEYVLHMTSAPPFSTATLILGVETVNAPFKGGVLVPSVDVVHGQLAVDGSGGMMFQGLLPASAQPGETVVFQVWFSDAGAPLGMAGSNALLATVAP